MAIPREHEASERLLIVNPAAGGGRAGKRAQAVVDALRAAGDGGALRVEETRRPGHASELAAAALREGTREFLTVGGDGTSYEVLNGLFPLASELGVRPRLGLVPAGTGNSFLRDFGVLDADAALAAIARRTPTRVDIVRAEHRDGVIHYLNLLGLGFTAQVGDLTNRRFKSLGALGYAAGTVSALAGLHQRVDTITTRHEDGERRDDRPATFLVFSNSKYTGGTMMMAPAADVRDGALDVIHVGTLSRVGLLRAFPGLYRGAHVDHPAVEAYQAREVVFEAPVEQPVMVDGEVVHLALKRLEVLPGALEVFV